MSDLNLGQTVKTPVQSTVYAETFRSALQDRFLGGLVRFPGRSWQSVLVSSGSVTRMAGDVEDIVVAPAILWAPRDEAVRLKARAGSHGAILTLGEVTLANAIGHKPEAAALRMMSARRMVIGLGGNPVIHASLENCYTAILQELEGGIAGMDTVIEAQIRILLVSLWRATATERHEDYTTAASIQILENFRQMVETHLRERWSVQRYAQELGISADRLHDICTRHLGKPPMRLIHERLTHEAQMLLERSFQTLDQLADYLGFRNTPQFSVFFKAQTGLPPGAFRRAIQRKDPGADVLQTRSYADWP